MHCPYTLRNMLNVIVYIINVYCFTVSEAFIITTVYAIFRCNHSSFAIHICRTHLQSHIHTTIYLFFPSSLLLKTIRKPVAHKCLSQRTFEVGFAFERRWKYYEMDGKPHRFYRKERERHGSNSKWQRKYFIICLCSVTQNITNVWYNIV